MAKVFLDTNALVDLVEREPKMGRTLVGHTIYCSPLSIHILFYVYKIKVPDGLKNKALKKIQIVSLTPQITNRSLFGPTSDFEDNVQLSSAIESNCDIFLTNDKKLRKMHFFGKTKISHEII